MKTIYKRTFEALKHPRGSEERIKLNKSSITSEYQTSHKYTVKDGVIERTFKTKNEAEQF